MISRTLWNLALLGAVASCSGDSKDTDSGAVEADADTDADSDSDSTPTGDTSPPGPQYFTVAGLAVSANFGWDNDTQSIVTPITDQGEVPPAIVLVFGNDNWVASAQTGSGAFTEADVCVMFLPLTTPTPVPQWVLDDPQIFFGFDYLPTDPAITDCNAAGGHPFDPNVSGGDAGFVGFWAGADPEFGVGVGALRPDSEVADTSLVVDAVVQQLAVPVDSIFGGVIQNAALPTGAMYDFAGTLRYVAFAHAMDASYNVLPDFLPATEIAVPSGGVATGSYDVVTTTLWTYGR